MSAAVTAFGVASAILGGPGFWLVPLPPDRAYRACLKAKGYADPPPEAMPTATSPPDAMPEHTPGPGL